VTDLIPWHTKSKVKLRESDSHISMDYLWKVQKTPVDDGLSASNAKSQGTQKRNACTSIFPLLVKIKIARLRPLPSAELKTREVVLDTLSIVQYSRHASKEDNVRVSSHNWIGMGKILTGHTLP
jgi:hypothetical protein